MAKTLEERLAEILKYSPEKFDNDKFQERFAKLKGISSERTGGDVSQALKEVVSRDVKDSQSMRAKAQKLDELAGILTFQALQNPNAQEKIQWLKEAKDAMVLGKSLQEKSSMQSLNERINEVSNLSTKESAFDALRALKEAKSAVRSAHSVKELEVRLPELEGAMRKVLTISAQSNSPAEKNKLIQEVRSAKIPYDAKIKQLNAALTTGLKADSKLPTIQQSKTSELLRRSSPPTEHKAPTANSKSSFISRLSGSALEKKLMAAGAIGTKVLDTLKKYFDKGKTAINRVQATSAIRSFRLYEKTMQMKNSINNVRNRLNDLEKPEQKQPTSRGRQP